MGITNFGIPVCKQGLSMHAMRLAMRAQGLTMCAFDFIDKNAQTGSHNAWLNLVPIWLVTYIVQQSVNLQKSKSMMQLYRKEKRLVIMRKL